MSNDNQPLIQVLVVDDSFFMRKMLKEVLDDASLGVSVIDAAQDGLEAIEKIKALKPDVVTLDVEMPKLDGLGALNQIMAECPTPVIMLSSHTGIGTETTLLALEAGAVDCVLKPSGKPFGDIRGIQLELVEKIKMAAKCKLRNRLLLKDTVLDSNVKIKNAKQSSLIPIIEQIERDAKFVVAVASSTGGPRALNELFSKIKCPPIASFVVVQHISIGFTKALARRLQDVSSFQFSEASAGEKLMGQKGYVAPAGSHLILTGSPGSFRFSFTDLPPRMGVKPSADILMSSVAKVSGNKCLGVILTGMGRDGTAGLKDIHSVGGKTYAQDEDSCVVYGMPKSAVESGAIDRQLPINIMADEINSFLSKLPTV
jgi:two-component system chemotaxis response regulator CheB